MFSSSARFVPAPPHAARLTQLVGWLALGLLVAAAIHGFGLGRGAPALLRGDEMWVKLLGLICAGVFVGAALVEAVQLGRRSERDAAPDAGQAEPVVDEPLAEEQGGAPAIR